MTAAAVCLGLSLVPGCSASEAPVQAQRLPRPLTRPPPASDLLDLTPMVLGGVRVRVWRRPVTSGVIQVAEERVADATAAQARVAALVSDGWHAWPPGPAPEAADTLAAANPAMRDCPYLMEESEEPENWLDEPAAHVACFQSVAELEKAREREEQILFRHSRAVPCAELRAAPRPADAQYLRELKEVCAAMSALPREPSDEEIRKAARTEQRNMRTVMPIAQH